MSRVGKMPVTVPQGVEVSIKADQISVKAVSYTHLRAPEPVLDLVCRPLLEKKKKKIKKNKKKQQNKKKQHKTYHNKVDT